MRLGRLATVLLTLKYQTKHFLLREVSHKQDTEENQWVSGVGFWDEGKRLASGVWDRVGSAGSVRSGLQSLLLKGIV